MPAESTSSMMYVFMLVCLFFDKNKKDEPTRHVINVIPERYVNRAQVSISKRQIKLRFRLYLISPISVCHSDQWYLSGKKTSASKQAKKRQNKKVITVY